MKNRIFNVSADFIVEFAEIIEENELQDAIIGVDTEEDEINISVEYDPEEQSQAILDMIEFIENLDSEEEDDV